MEFHQNKAANQGTQPENELPRVGSLHNALRHELRRIVNFGGAQPHVRNALRCLDALLGQMGDGSGHQHWKRGISPEAANATRAALELIREQTFSLERSVLRAENHWRERRVAARLAAQSPTPESAE
jgi:hypothetical protein